MTRLTFLSRVVPAIIVVLCIGVGVLLWLSAPDSEPDIPLTPATPTAPLSTEAPATPVITDDSAPQESCEALKVACDIGDVDACIEAKSRHCDLVDSEVGYSGGDATSPENIARAHDLIEQAHEGIGNVWHNDIHTGQPGCGTDCMTAINDAASKTKAAYTLLGDDVLSRRTWDKNQTVAHAFAAAEYWIDEVNVGETDSGDAAPHALYQLGILRDVLAPAKASE